MVLRITTVMFLSPWFTLLERLRRQTTSLVPLGAPSRASLASWKGQLVYHKDIPLHLLRSTSSGATKDSSRLSERQYELESQPLFDFETAHYPKISCKGLRGEALTNPVQKQSFSLCDLRMVKTY
jgi:hypothetical protein